MMRMSLFLYRIGNIRSGLKEKCYGKETASQMPNTCACVNGWQSRTMVDSKVPNVASTNKKRKDMISYDYPSPQAI